MWEATQIGSHLASCPVWLAESARLSKIYVQLLNILFTAFDIMMSYAGVNTAVFSSVRGLPWPFDKANLGF